MALGPGKYDDLCTYVRTKAKADGALVVIINGELGGGFSAQLSLLDTIKMAATLREIADKIDSEGYAKA